MKQKLSTFFVHFVQFSSISDGKLLPIKSNQTALFCEMIACKKAVDDAVFRASFA